MIIESTTNRVLVLGCSGSGKSTLSRILGRQLNLPVIHLDIHFWQPGWVEPDNEKWRSDVEKLASDDQWVMDGTFSESFDVRFPRADKIIRRCYRIGRHKVARITTNIKSGGDFAGKPQ